MSERDNQFEKLKVEMREQLYFMDKFLKAYRSGEHDTKYLVYEFQSLMDGLVPIKEKADTLTRTLDHG